jgi:hypothetical protein
MITALATKKIAPGEALVLLKKLLAADARLFEAGQALTEAGLPHGKAHTDVVRLWVSQAMTDIQDAAYVALDEALTGQEAAVG